MFGVIFPNKQAPEAGIQSMLTSRQTDLIHLFQSISTLILNVQNQSA